MTVKSVQPEANRAKLILFVVIVVCLAMSAALIFVVLRGAMSRRSPSNPANDSHPGAGQADDSIVFAGYGKASSCKACHPQEYQHWAGSHHALAERSIEPSIDQSAFEPARAVSHGTQTSEVHRVNNRFEILTDGLNGKEAVFTAERIIGVAPLRQFLVPAAGGRLQSTEIAFDPLRQDWFDVYGKEDRKPGEWGHWTGRGMTWNSMCAACHNTRLRKNYDSRTDGFKTTMAEMGVGCESCHGPLAAHNQWQNQHRNEKGDPNVKRLTRDQMLDTCGSCHARRAELTGNFKPGDNFFDHYALAVPDDTEIFYPDGQIHEEDYEFTSFLSSRMYSAGVRCIDCHEPHSAKTKAPGNALCLTCHGPPAGTAPKIDSATHSHHQTGKPGDNCIDCHMPTTTYMQRHARHDHGFTVPDPRLTKEFDVPNACGRCHQDRGADWAVEQVNQAWPRTAPIPSQKRSRIIARARRSDPSSPEELISLIAGETNALWRASAVGLLRASTRNPKVTTTLAATLADRSPMVRSASIRGLESQEWDRSPVVRTAILARLDDPIRSVRVEAAWALRATLETNLVAGRDLIAQLTHNSDQPAGALQMGVFFLDRGNTEASLFWLERAVRWDTNSAPLHHEFAIVLSKSGRLDESVRELQTACALAPREPEYRFKLALALNETGDAEGAKKSLQQAVKLDAQFARAWYNLGLAYNSGGETGEALNCLVRAESIDTDSALIPYARATILARLGRSDEARKATRRALELQPDFSEAKDLLNSLGE